METTFWSENARQFWPRNPTGYIFLAQAADMIGRLLFPKVWKIDDMAVRPRFETVGKAFQPVPSPSIARNPVLQRHPSVAEQKIAFEKLAAEVAEHNNLVGPARWRASEIMRAIVAAAENGRLEVHYLGSHDHVLRSVPLSEWTVPSVGFDLVRECLISPREWMPENSSKAPAELFVSEYSLRRVDWKQIEWRSEPAPLDGTTPALEEPKKPDFPLSPPANGPVTVSKVDDEIRNLVKQRLGGDAVYKALKGKFPSVSRISFRARHGRLWEDEPA